MSHMLGQLGNLAPWLHVISLLCSVPQQQQVI